MRFFSDLYRFFEPFILGPLVLLGIALLIKKLGFAITAILIATVVAAICVNAWHSNKIARQIEEQQRYIDYINRQLKNKDRF